MHGSGVQATGGVAWFMWSTLTRDQMIYRLLSACTGISMQASYEVKAPRHECHGFPVNRFSNIVTVHMHGLRDYRRESLLYICMNMHFPPGV